MKDYLISKNIDKNKVFSTGIPISSKFLKHYDKKEILDEFGLEENKTTILFFGGGEFGLGKNQTVEIFENLVKNFNNIQIIAIAGKNLKMKSNFENIIKLNHKSNSVKLLEYTNKVPELMSISDLVISKPGGLTTSESLASNLPIIIINPIPGQEEENAEFLEKKHCGIWIKKGIYSIDIFNDLFSNPEKLEKLKDNTKTLAKKHSTEEICKILLN